MIKSKVLFRTAVILLLAVGSFILTCGKKGTDDELPDVIIKPNVKVLSESETSHLVSGSADNDTLVFSSGNGAPSLETGQIIVSSVGEGFLKIVKSVDVSAGSMVVITEPAALTDAVEKADIEFSRKITADDIRRSGKLPKGFELVETALGESVIYFKLDRIPLTSGNNDTIMVSGEIKIFEPEFQLDCKISSSSCERIEMKVLGRVQLTLEGAALRVLEYKPEGVWVSFPSATFIIPLGVLPVVVTPAFDIIYEASAKASAGLSVSADLESQFSVGGTWTPSGGLQGLQDLSLQVNPQISSQPLMAKATFRASPVGIKPVLKLYGLRTTYTKVSPYLQLSVDPFATSWWLIDAGVDLRVGIKLHLWSRRLMEVEATLLGYKTTIASSSESCTDCTPPARTTDLRASAATSNSITLSWTSPGDDANSGTALKYDLRYSTTSITQANWDQAIQLLDLPTPRVAGSSEAFVVDGLDPNTRYYFALRTADEEPNWSGLSNTVNATTLQDGVIGQISNVTISPLSPAPQVGLNATIGWNSQGLVGESVKIEIWNGAYWVALASAAANGAGTNSFSVVIPSGSTHANAGLAGTGRKVRVSSNIDPTIIGESALFAVDGFNIIQPNGTESWLVGSTQDISWTKRGGYALVDIYISNDGGATWPTRIVNDANSTSPYRWTIPQTLSGSTNCRIKVQDGYNPVVNDISDADFSIGPEGTEDLPPAAVTSLAAGNPTNSSVTLTWTAPGDDGNTGQASSYDIRYSASQITSSNWSSATQAIGEPTPKTAGSSETFTVTGLSPSTTYYFAMKTADEVPNWSGVSNVTTGQTSSNSAFSSITVSPTRPQIGNLLTIQWQGNETDTLVIQVWDGSGYVLFGSRFPSETGSNQFDRILENGDSARTSNWAGNDRRVYITSRITGWRDSSIAFPIDGFVLNSPNGGEIWKSGITNDITWEKVGNYTLVDIYCSTDGGVTWPILIANDASSTPPFHWTIPGSVSPSNNCLIRVQDGNTASVNEISDVVFSITPGSQIDATPPATIADLAASNPTSSSVTLTWTAAGDDGNTGQATTYDVRYSTSTITSSSWNTASQASGEPSPKAAGSSETFTITGLTPNTSYYFALKAGDEVPNWSDLSNVPSANTSGLSGSWSALSSGMSNTVSDLTVYDEKLIAGGQFWRAGGVVVKNIASWDGSSWLPLGLGTDGTVNSVTVYDDALIAGGWFSTAGGVSVHDIASWDGNNWSPLGSGMTGTPLAMTVFDGNLIAGGLFEKAGGGIVNNIASWDGSSWSPLGSGMSWVDYSSAPVQSLVVYSNKLIAGGDCLRAGGEIVNYIASWNGISWSSLGSGMGGGSYRFVSALAVYENKLIVGGSFATASGVVVNNIASWDGSSWSPLGSGTDGHVYALTIYHNKLIAGGDFTTASGVSASNIASWNGSSWSPLGPGMTGDVRALTVFDGKLIAGGGFTTAGGITVNYIAAWTE